MSFVNVSSWSFSHGYDEAQLAARAHETLHLLREQAPVEAYMVKTSASEVLFVMVYPDEAAYRKATEALSARRDGVLDAVGGTLAGDYKGADIIAL